MRNSSKALYRDTHCEEFREKNEIYNANLSDERKDEIKTRACERYLEWGEDRKKAFRAAARQRGNDAYADPDKKVEILAK